MTVLIYFVTSSLCSSTLTRVFPSAYIPDVASTELFDNLYTFGAYLVLIKYPSDCLVSPAITQKSSPAIANVVLALKIQTRNVKPLFKISYFQVYLEIKKYVAGLA